MKLHKIILCVLSIFLLQFSLQDESVTGRDKPKINIYGTIVDRLGREFNAENITVGGAYKQIIMYLEPAATDTMPSHKVRIDLAEECKISIPLTMDNKPIISKFKNKDYITVDVISKDQKTRGRYIVPRHTRVYFDQVVHGSACVRQTSESAGIKNNCPAREHETTFEELKEIIIKGYKERDDKKTIKRVSLYNYDRKYIL